MSGEARSSEREAILRERAAFVLGAGYAAHPSNVVSAAERRYPLPKVERPRIVRDSQSAYDFRAVNGMIEARPVWLEGSAWSVASGFDVTAARVELWAALLASPTELVDEPDPGVSS